jgi:prepilin-type N-terminal cleavage/methylation domain-containing protein
MLKYVKPSQSAFTLVEISIVIVIIGLVLGGILVGRDLIAAAEQRRFITQIEQYKTAVHTFRSKYNGIPGDLPNGTAFGFAGNGNGDGCVTGCRADISDLTVQDFGPSNNRSELSLFWNMLSGASLINGRYDGDTGSVATDTISRTIPAATLNPSIGLLGYYGTVSMNLWPGAGARTKHFISMASNPGGVLFFDRTVTYGGSSQITPLTAQNIDQKMDDGFPGSGTVVVAAAVDGFFDQTAIDGSADITGATLGSEYCAYLGAGARWFYNLASRQGNCWMRFEGGF